MAVYMVRRFIQAIFVLMLTTVVIFLLMRLLPGDPVLLYVSQDEYERTTSQPEIDALRAEFGLDKPLAVQYFVWLGGVFRGDLGKSIFWGTTVRDEIARALPVSLWLGSSAWLISHLVGPLMGLVCAIRRSKWQDTLLTTLANIGITAPIFWVGILMIYAFGLHLSWFPIQGYVSPLDDFGDSVYHLIIPVFVLSVTHLAGGTRQMRSSMLEVVRQDYIRTAWAKGLRERTVVFRHALKPGVLPVVTLSGMSIPALFGGSVLIETVFNIPGMGLLSVNALFSQDYAIVQGVNLMIASIVVMANFIVDISYGWLDPRVRYQ
ncbi:ABC transporter permease [Chloroflexota bacterium]